MRTIHKKYFTGKVWKKYYVNLSPSHLLSKARGSKIKHDLALMEFLIEWDAFRFKPRPLLAIITYIYGHRLNKKIFAARTASSALHHLLRHNRRMDGFRIYVILCCFLCGISSPNNEKSRSRFWGRILWLLRL